MPTAADAPSVQASSGASMPDVATPEAVDVEAVLRRLAARKGVTFNWQSSIIDLMKLLDLDSSLANRKELSNELGYSDAKDGSAEINIWLYKAVLRELERNAGYVSGLVKD
ncbi:hypothetical protein HD841_000888 [Sphingomonas melonis]|uniref:DUF3597 domain-containing protein n=2 Tax=Sphingomonas melonis TaxID=152682 RepID=A0A7Y9K1P4_9SPHN|nr:DUF3597 domain-containing protein [Sphingomonas melonis]NYD89119.1 hypothetical protein [Sphingomonas melonis]